MTTATIDATRQATAVVRHWIDGRWRDSAEHRDSINPATGEVIGRYARAGEDEAREATAVALRTFRETTWKNDRALRSRVLFEMALRFEARAADLIQLMSLEVGEFEEGGYKQSGRGRLRGLAGLDDFLEYKHIVLKPGVVAS